LGAGRRNIKLQTHTASHRRLLMTDDEPERLIGPSQEMLGAQRLNIVEFCKKFCRKVRFSKLNRCSSKPGNEACEMLLMILAGPWQRTHHIGSRPTSR
jgi:hypothetical protein